jgi:hypothetical protein
MRINNDRPIDRLPMIWSPQSPPISSNPVLDTLSEVLDRDRSLAEMDIVTTKEVSRRMAESDCERLNSLIGVAGHVITTYGGEVLIPRDAPKLDDGSPRFNVVRLADNETAKVTGAARRFEAIPTADRQAYEVSVRLFDSIVDTAAGSIDVPVVYQPVHAIERMVVRPAPLSEDL